jgi:hypothetical protein
MRGYNKNNKLHFFSWTPHPLPLPIVEDPAILGGDVGRGKYLNYDTVSKWRRERNIVKAYVSSKSR